MIKPAIGVFLQLSRSSFGGWPKETHESQCFHFYPCKDQRMKVLIWLAVGGPSLSYMAPVKNVEQAVDNLLDVVHPHQAVDPCRLCF